MDAHRDVTDDGRPQVERRPLGRLAGRFGWGLGDQIFSSLTNFALTFLVARSVGVTGFGAFAIAFTVYLTALGFSRAVASSPLSIRFSAVDAVEWREATRDATGTALGLGAALGALCAGVGFLLEDPLRWPLVVLGSLLPALLLQDAWRYAFFAQGRGGRAFVNDVVWAVPLLPALVVLSAAGADGAAPFVAAWGGSAAIAGVAGMAQARAVPRPLRTLAWWTRHRDLAGWFVWEFVAIRGSAQMASFGVAAVLGVEVIGAIRGGTVLLGPVNTVVMGLGLVAVPEGVRMAASAPHRLGRTMLSVSGGVAVLALAWGAVLLLLPDAVGRELLGETWEPARAIVVPLTLRTAIGGAALGFTSGLRALAAARETFRARLIVTALNLVGVFGGAFIGRSAAGVAWGETIANGLSFLVWGRAFESANRNRRAASAGSGV